MNDIEMRMQAAERELLDLRTSVISALVYELVVAVDGYDDLDEKAKIVANDMIASAAETPVAIDSEIVTAHSVILQLLDQVSENYTIVYRGFTRVTLYWKQGHLCVEIHTNEDDCLIPDNRKQDTAFMRHVLATNLLSIRKVLGLSQEDLEESTGVSTNEIGKIEREETSPGLDTITVA